MNVSIVVDVGATTAHHQPEEDPEMYVNKSSESITFDQWVTLMSDPAFSRIGLDSIGASTVSTVWTGSPCHPFETLVMGGHLDEEGDSYDTEQDARDGHAAMVARCAEQEAAR